MTCAGGCRHPVQLAAAPAICAALIAAFPAGALTRDTTTAEPQANGAPNAASALGRIGPVRIPLEVSLKVNDKFLGTISIAVDPKGDGEIDAARLLALLKPVVGAELITALTARIAGRTKVDFADLRVDGFAIAFDSLALEVVGTLAADATLPATLRFGAQQAVPVPTDFDRPAGFAAGVNVGMGQRYVYGRGGGLQPVRADIDGIVNAGGFDGVTFTGGATFDGDRWRRREFRATHDLFDHAVRATVGEFTPSSTSFQGSGRILGIGVERAYSTIRPFQNTRPIGRQQFTLDRESSVDVLVNQVRVQTIRLAPGRYDIGDFPFANGPNQVQLVVEDIGGKREILNFDVFNTNTLINPGLTEYGFALGVRDRGQLRYGLSPALTAYAFHGVSDTLTLGANAQATRLGVQVGGVAVLGTRIGFVQVETSASKARQGGGTGFAASLDYRGEFSLRSKSDLRIAGSAVYRSAAFRDAFARDVQNFQALEAGLQVQWIAPFAISTGVGLGYSMARYGGADSYRVDLSLGRSFGRLGVNVTGGRVVFRDGRRTDNRVALGVSLRLGRRDYATVRYDSGTGRKEVELSRTPEGRLDELSGAIRYTQDRDATAVSGRLAYVNNRYDLVLNHNRLERNGPGGGTVNASDWNIRSFVGFADGSFGVGRAASEGFIIAPVHRTLRGSRAAIFSGDRVVARSGLFGPAVIPIGRAYGVGRYDLRVDPLPIGYDLGQATINVFPGYGSGYRFPIGSDESLIAVGFLIGPDGPVALAAGTIEPVDPARRKAWKERSFFTNRGGRFVADRLAPGRYQLLLGGNAVAAFEIRKGTQGMVDVGKLSIVR